MIRCSNPSKESPLQDAAIGILVLEWVEEVDVVPEVNDAERSHKLLLLISDQ